MEMVRSYVGLERTTMNQHIDINKAVELINSKKISVDEMCEFIYKDISNFQDSRETYYMDQFKEEFGSVNIKDKKALADRETSKMIKKIENDVKKYSIEYANRSIDAILDAMNLKLFKYKKRPKDFLVLLTTLKEMNEY